MTYKKIQDAVNGGFLVIEVNDTTGEELVVARCPSETRASLIVTALNA